MIIVVHDGAATGMKLSEGVEAAVHSAIVLAELPAGATLPGAALAEYHGISGSYLLKHLKDLVAASILESVPGPAGGYLLRHGLAGPGPLVLEQGYEMLRPSQIEVGLTVTDGVLSRVTVGGGVVYVGEGVIQVGRSQ